MSKSKQLFVLQNQDKYFLSKEKQWVDGTDLKALFSTPHRDIAVNQMFEVNAQDYSQRIHVLDCEVAGKNQPVLEPGLMPPPTPKQSEEQPDDAAPAQAETPAPAAEPATDTEAKATEEQKAVEPEEELLVHEV